MMKTEIITSDDIKRYLGLIEITEISGMEDGRFTLFGCFDEDSQKVMGVLVAELLGPAINIKRIFVKPEYRRKGVARLLLSKVTDLPENLRAPVIVYGAHEELNFRFLSAVGFGDTNSKFTCVDGKLGEFKKLSMPGNSSEYSVLPAEDVSEELIQDYLAKAGIKLGVDISDLLLKEDPFSDGSIICLKDGAVAAFLILDEAGRRIEVPLIHGDDQKAIFYCLAALYEELSEEYGPDAGIRFILYEEKGLDAVFKLLENATEKELYLFAYER